MHVTRALILLAVASTLGCQARPDRARKVGPLVLPRASSAPDAAAAVDPSFLPLARAARDAATKVASACHMRSEWGELYTRYSDRCTFVPADVAALRASAAALGAAPAPTQGEALVFAEEVRLFTSWLDLVQEGTPGTLSHYQGLASAWNGFQPADRIPVDLRTKDAYDGTVIVGGEGGKLAWRRCSTGPCVLVPRKDQ